MNKQDIYELIKNKEIDKRLILYLLETSITVALSSTKPCSTAVTTPSSIIMSNKPSLPALGSTKWPFFNIVLINLLPFSFFGLSYCFRIVQIIILYIIAYLDMLYNFQICSIFHITLYYFFEFLTKNSPY